VCKTENFKLNQSNQILFDQNTSDLNAASGKNQLMSRANKAQKGTYSDP